MRRMVKSEITIIKVVDGKVDFDLSCLDCGGVEQEMRGDPGMMAMLYCKACGGWIGRVAALYAHACMKAKTMGYEVDMEPLRRTQNESKARNAAIKVRRDKP